MSYTYYKGTIVYYRLNSEKETVEYYSNIYEQWCDMAPFKDAFEDGVLVTEDEVNSYLMLKELSR